MREGGGGGTYSSNEYLSPNMLNKRKLREYYLFSVINGWLTNIAKKDNIIGWASLHMKGSQGRPP